MHPIVDPSFRQVAAQLQKFFSFSEINDVASFILRTVEFKYNN